MSDKQEIEFQKWLKQQDSDMREDLCSWYAFIGWLAALDSVVVDIKNLPSASYTSSGLVYLSDVVEAIEKAGVRHNDE